MLWTQMILPRNGLLAINIKGITVKQYDCSLNECSSVSKVSINRASTECQQFEFDLLGNPRVGSISNNRSLHRQHPGVPDASDGSDGTSYALTENYTFPAAQATRRVAHQSTWERRQQTWERLGAPRITVEHSGKTNIFFGNAAGAPGTHSYY
jgi:hypothetical protein